MNNCKIIAIDIIDYIGNCDWVSCLFLFFSIAIHSEHQSIQLNWSQEFVNSIRSK